MRRIFLGLFFFILTFGFFTSFTSPLQAYTFTKSLKYGSMDPDVRELQKILNSDPETRVTTQGVGSLGSETIYFGLLTHQAVIKFQNKYADEILKPAGITRGNGFVGPNTLKKLNSLGQTAQVPQNPNNTALNIDFSANLFVKDSEKIDIYSTDTNIEKNKALIGDEINSAIREKRVPSAQKIMSIAQSIKNKVMIARISSMIGKPGNKVTIQGLGFDSTNSVYFGPNYVIRNVASAFNALTINVPPLPQGRYDVVINNKQGVSNSYFFVITGTSTPPVQITSISPTTGRYGDILVIRGSGFTATNNEVITTVGNIKGVPSLDGTTLTIKIEPLAFQEISKSNNQNKKTPIGIVVVNDNGYAESPVPYTIQY
jgi:peptidoglycan hydrolase-like protein with peptidoglycan-binding domain